MDPRNISVSDFTYNLPDERVAKYPLEKRDNSKLLVHKAGEISEARYKDIADLLPEETMLIFNDTKVVEARLLFKKETGAVIEIFCLEPDGRYSDITSAMLQKGTVVWKCLIGGASKWKHGMKLKKVLQANSVKIVLEAAIVARLSDCFLTELSWSPATLSFAELLHFAGELPLPPYLHRQTEENDKNRYQTVYARQEGSVAAPTAGLHFTDDLLKKLAEKI